ncbi:MAG: LysM peptidoglycan-binding domain-containing protein [Desulfobacterales bacterium]|nr:LysM peptidoglycan-binding domain-containing protein [Desulfobacterales bacterium]
MKYTSRIFKHFVLWACISLLIIFGFCTVQAQEKQKTYSISLVRTADTEEGISEISDRKVLTKEYTVRDGDRIYNILREMDLLEQYDASELLSMVKELNKSVDNLDLIHPGEKIVIPLKIVPKLDDSDLRGISLGKKAGALNPKDLESEPYTVRPGDWLVKIIGDRYNVSGRNAYEQYLGLVKKLNPSIKDIDLIYSGRIIRLPIYSPEVVRKPIETAASKPKSKRGVKKTIHKNNPLAGDLGIIFLEMGEEWVQTGEHFIPLKSGGQLNLNAQSFPIINLRNGLRVVVDLNNKLPEHMAKLIESNWGNYRIARIAEEDKLDSALGKILKTCSYPKIHKKSEPFEVRGDITFSITGDWIVNLPEARSDDDGPKVAIINLRGPNGPYTPHLIKTYLGHSGIKMIDYPSGDNKALDPMHDVVTIEGGTDPASLIEAVLNTTGLDFSSKVEMPFYQSQRADFQLMVNADFLVNIKGRDAIIDLSGLDDEIISFLKSHKFSVLSLAGKKEPLDIIAKTLEFLGIQFDPGPYTFFADTKDDSGNISLTFPGIVFPDSRKDNVIATPLDLPDEISILLSQKGLKFLTLNFFRDP